MELNADLTLEFKAQTKHCSAMVGQGQSMAEGRVCQGCMKFH